MKVIISLWRGHLLAMLGGACAVFSFSPFHYWIVLCIITGVFYLLLENLSIKAAAWRGFFFGFGFFGTGIYWMYISIHQFGNTSSWFAALLMMLLDIFLAIILFVPFCALYSWLHLKCKEHAYRVLLFSGLWVLSEIFRGWFLTGLPWLLSGYTLINTPVTSWAAVVGVFGLSLLMTVFSSTVAHWIKYPYGVKSSFILAFCLIIICLSWPLSQVHWTHPVGKQLSFKAVQGNIPQQIRWNQAYVENILHTYLQLSQQSGDTDILIWPENAIPVPYQDMPDLIATLREKANKSNTAFVFGVPWRENNKYYNAVAVIGKGSGHYLKQKLVPFGEFLPLEFWLRGLINFFSLPMSSFSKGPSNQSLVILKGYPVAIYICYEAIYPDFSAQLAKGSAFIITVSNDSWFGHSVGPWQHFQMVRMRAIETGRYLINDTNDSATSLISPKGQVTQQLPSFRSGVLKGSIQPMVGSTPFMHYKSLPVLMLSLILVLFPLIQRRKKHNAKVLK